jgi:hypothetical protein
MDKRKSKNKIKKIINVIFIILLILIMSVLSILFVTFKGIDFIYDYGKTFIVKKVTGVVFNDTLTVIPKTPIVEAIKFNDDMITIIVKDTTYKYDEKKSNIIKKDSTKKEQYVKDNYKIYGNSVYKIKIKDKKIIINDISEVSYIDFKKQKIEYKNTFLQNKCSLNLTFNRNGKPLLGFSYSPFKLKGNDLDIIVGQSWASNKTKIDFGFGTSRRIFGNTYLGFGNMFLTNKFRIYISIKMFMF